MRRNVLGVQQVFQLVEFYVLGLEDDIKPAIGRRVDQVARHLGLAIDHDMPAGEPGDVDTDKLLASGEIEAFLLQSDSVQPGIDAQFVKQIGRDRLQHTGADPAFDVDPALSLDDDAVYSRGAQKMSEQQSCGTASDDRDLRFCAYRRARGRPHALSCLSRASSTR